VRGPGTLVPEQIRYISAVTGGRVENVPVRPGAQVQPGTVLMTFSNPDVELQWLSAQQAVASAQAQLVTLRTNLESSRLAQMTTVGSVRAQLREAQRQAAAVPALVERNLIAANEVQRLRDEVERLENQLTVEQGAYTYVGPFGTYLYVKPICADYDGDKKADPAYFAVMTLTEGMLKLWSKGVYPSTDNYQSTTYASGYSGAEYNPFEFIKTNINGAMNVIECALERKVKRVIALSTDKACNPINLYGATKLCSDKLFVSGNAYSGKNDIRFGVVRYGNVMGSRGSIIPYFRELAHTGVLPITDARMTRFMISLEQGVELVWHALADCIGGEIYVKKIPSMKIVDIARAIAPKAKLKIIGTRPGEKLHEEMVSIEDAPYTYEYPSHFKILPQIHGWAKEPGRIGKGKPCKEGFSYNSGTNQEWMTQTQFRTWLGKEYKKA